MNYDVLINTAIEKNEVLQLLRGEKEYEVIVSEFSPDIFPTDITSVLVECFYKQMHFCIMMKSLYSDQSVGQSF